MSANLRAYLILGLVFVLGAATGVGAMYAYGRRSHGHIGELPRGRMHIERRLTELKDLKLTPEQQTQVTAIFERQREPRQKLMRETMERCGDPVRKLRDATDAEIRALLSIDQQPQFDDIVRARNKRLATP